MSNEAEAELTRLLERIFADDVVDIAERSALLEFQADGRLDPRGIERVFASFVDTRWGAAMADGVLTTHEKLVLRRILEELELRDDAVPLQLRLALRTT